MKKKKALIFGVSGQDGSYLAEFLLHKGYVVHGTSRDTETNKFPNLDILGIKNQVVLHSVSVTDFRNVFQVLNTVQPDEIYNLAGQTSVGLSFQQPLETFESIAVGTLNVMECVRLTGLHTRFFNAASSESYGDSHLPVTELSPFQPRSPYATAKATAYWNVANYREAYKLFACSGILFNHESPLRPSRFVTKKVVSAAVRIARGSHEKLKLGNLNVSRDWGWAVEYVDAMWRILQNDQPEDFIVATGKTHSLEQFVKQTFSCLRLNWQDHVEVDGDLFRPSELSEIRANPTKIAQKLGWKAKVEFEELLQLMVDHEVNRQSKH